ncbi:MAG: hypothetical protein ACI4ET_10280, partial [Bilifractor sp.]
MRQRENHYWITYSREGEEKHQTLITGDLKKVGAIGNLLRKKGFHVDRTDKAYPINMMRNQHNF